MRILKLIVTVAAFVGFLVWANPTLRAETTQIPDRIMGNINAPITVLEYVSMTCSHCAEFYKDTLPELKKRYVETGKVRFILRDFPLDGVALKASTIARCMPEEQFYPFISVLYGNMAQWISSTDPDKTLIQYAKLGGLSEEKAKTCLNDTKLIDAIVAERTDGTKKYDIQATPTFIINDGAEKIMGGRKIEDFAAVFDRMLAAKH